MVCNRCIKAVQDLLISHSYEIISIELGKVIIENNLDQEAFDILTNELHKNGFELINDKQSRIIDNIKTLIIKFIHHKNDFPKHINLSNYISSEIGNDYSYLSKLFSSTEGVTIEKYVILQKIERVKELIKYDELNLNEIADELGYSSTQHLSGQFKKVTGLTPTEFKHHSNNSRKPLDKVSE